MIKLISFENAKYDTSFTIGLDIIRQHLESEGINVSVDNIFHLFGVNEHYINYGTHIVEMGDLEIFLKLVYNFRNNIDLLENIELFHNQKDVFNLLDEYIEREINSNIDLIGQSVTYVNFIYMAYLTLKIKKKYPNIEFVYGGYQPTLSKNFRDICLGIDLVDYVVIDDGCEPMYYIYHNLVNSRCITGEFAKQIEWPKYTKYHSNLTQGKLSSITSFGCPFNCDFCASKRPYRSYNLNKFREYLKEMKSQGFHRVTLGDDTALPSKNRALELANAFMGLDLKWECHGNALAIDEEVSQKLSDSGCVEVFIGAESFSEKVLENICKPGFHANSVVDAVNYLCEKEIITNIGIITGLPGETEEIFKDTFKILKDLYDKYGSYASICSTSMKIYPGSSMYLYPEKYDLEFTYWDEEVVKDFPEIKDIVIKMPKLWKRKNQEELDVGRRRLKLVRKIFFEKYNKETEQIRVLKGMPTLDYRERSKNG